MPAKLPLKNASNYMLSKGLLQDNKFISVLVKIEMARRAEPLKVVTVLVDNDFAFPDPEVWERLEDWHIWYISLSLSIYIYIYIYVIIVPRGPNEQKTNRHPPGSRK